MYYDYSNSEAGFLSVYTASKLEQGGEPEISPEELQKALRDFVSSSYYSSGISEIKKLRFKSAEKLAADFQAQASENRSWLKECFVAENGKLFPTYNFFNIVEENNCLANFLWKYKFEKPSCNQPEESKIHCSEETKKTATAAAKYITKFYAAEYIQYEIASGYWPRNMTDISNIFKKDLASILERKGTKKYFISFYHHLRSNLAKMIENANGHLILSNRKTGNLAYNNLSRLLTGYENFDNMNSSGYYKTGEKKFSIVINNGTVKSNESTLTYSDPYEDDDEYSNKEIELTR